MNKVEEFWAQRQEILLDLHDKMAAKLDKLSFELANNESLSDQDREKLDKLVFDTYMASEYLRNEIL